MEDGSLLHFIFGGFNPPNRNPIPNPKPAPTRNPTPTQNFAPTRNPAPPYVAEQELNYNNGEKYIIRYYKTPSGSPQIFYDQERSSHLLDAIKIGLKHCNEIYDPKREISYSRKQGDTETNIRFSV